MAEALNALVGWKDLERVTRINIRGEVKGKGGERQGVEAEEQRRGQWNERGRYEQFAVIYSSYCKLIWSINQKGKGIVVGK